MRLIVTEKPSVAQAIAAALDIQDKKAGYCNMKQQMEPSTLTRPFSAKQ